MKKTPLKKDGAAAIKFLAKEGLLPENYRIGPDDSDRHQENFFRALLKWQKTLDKWEAELNAARKLGAVAFAMVLLSGCAGQPFITYEGPGVSGAYHEFIRPTQTIIVKEDSFWPPGYYPGDQHCISRNDFIIAMEGGF